MKLAVYAESCEMPRRGFGGAVTWMPSAWRRSMTPFQLDESAKAPWTRTTVIGALAVAPDVRAPWCVFVDDRLGERLRRAGGGEEVDQQFVDAVGLVVVDPVRGVG